MSSATHILLIRHGHVDGIVPKRFRGRMDLPLSREGQMQARQAASYISARYSPDAVYCSPLLRCVESAACLTQALALLPARIAPRLNDTDYGQWQGRLATDVAREQVELYSLWRQHPDRVRFPGGESLIVVAERALAGLHAIAMEHAGGTVAVYGHDSVIRLVILAALGAPFSTYHRLEIEPCSLSELIYDGNAPAQVGRVNERTS